MLVRIKRRARKAHVEAHGTTHAALRLALHALRAGEPILHVIIRIDKGNAHLLGEADILVFANLVFLQRVDVGVIEKDGEINPVRHHLFHQLARAWRAAGVHQHLVAVPTGYGKIDLLDNFGSVFSLVHAPFILRKPRFRKAFM